MAKKSAKELERRARVEQLRREQARKERSRSLLILGACIVLVVGLLAAALIPYIKHQRQQSALASTPISKLGVSASAAACSPEQTKDAKGSGQHLPIGQSIPYPDAPPAFGPHWGNYLQGSEIRTFYTTSDRPPLERLVHSLEHGHTILWYDDTIKAGSSDYKAIQQIGDRLGLDSYFIAAPWTSSDENGKAFPSGKHVALTHWTGPSAQKGVTEYCGKPSGAVIGDFVKKYPKTVAPEPGAA
ncbi:MAG: DUF3105 domain-containing protein [Marmoricola sp.]|nr:DUF3105 domain-containing protein [Marmoricola sp.]